VRDDDAKQDARRTVPVRRVFPWWYLVGAVVTLAVLVLVQPDGGSAVVALWGPSIGLAIADRQKAATARSEQGLPVDRASLLSPAWHEPVCAALLTTFTIGLGFLFGALFGVGTSATWWVGPCFLIGSGLGFLVLITVLRVRHHRRPTAVD